MQPVSTDAKSCATACGCGARSPHMRTFLLIAALLPGSVYYFGLAGIYFTRPLWHWPGFHYNPFNYALASLALYGLIGAWALALAPKLRQPRYKLFLASLLIGWVSGFYILLRGMIYWMFKTDMSILAGDPATAAHGGTMVMLTIVLALVLLKFSFKSARIIQQT